MVDQPRGQGDGRGDPADGQERLQRVRQIFTIADGKFAGYWCVTNFAGPARQLTGEQVVAGAGT